MEKEDFEVLLVKFKILVDDIRFAKDQQWRIPYYSLLLFFAIIFIQAGPSSWEPKRASQLIITFILVVAVAFSIGLLWANYKVIKRYRGHSNKIHDLFKNDTGEQGRDIEDEIQRAYPPRQCEHQQNRRTLLGYTMPFIVLVLLGSSIAAIITWDLRW